MLREKSIPTSSLVRLERVALVMTTRSVPHMGGPYSSRERRVQTSVDFVSTTYVKGLDSVPSGNQ